MCITPYKALRVSVLKKTAKERFIELVHSNEETHNNYTARQKASKLYIQVIS